MRFEDDGVLQRAWEALKDLARAAAREEDFVETDIARLEEYFEDEASERTRCYYGGYEAGYEDARTTYDPEW